MYITTERIQRMDTDQVIESIVSTLESINQFWSDARGWAPKDAADLLMRSRLDWLVSLGESLRIWLRELPEADGDGPLILAWANLGALVEGTMKILLCVYQLNYQASPSKVIKRGKEVDPDSMQFEDLRQFYNKEQIWLADEKWDVWLSRVQQYRNAIHAFRVRDIGTADEFMDDIRQLCMFIQMIDSRLPYPEYLDYSMENS